MKLANHCSIGLAILTTLALSGPTVSAHNLFKYTNVPFVLAANCGSTSSAQVISTKGVASIQASNPSLLTGFCGFSMYCSTPTSGTTPTTTTATFPQGTLTCNFTSNTPLISSGLTQNCGGFLQVNNAGTTVGIPLNATISGNVMTLTCINGAHPAAPVIAVFLGIGSTTGPVSATFSNFRYNNTSVLFDSTQVDSGSATNAAGTTDFCN